jgi:hypothetical protein
MNHIVTSEYRRWLGWNFRGPWFSHPRYEPYTYCFVTGHELGASVTWQLRLLYGRIGTPYCGRDSSLYPQGTMRRVTADLPYLVPGLMLCFMLKEEVGSNVGQGTCSSNFNVSSFGPYSQSPRWNLEIGHDCFLKNISLLFMIFFTSQTTSYTSSPTSSSVVQTWINYFGFGPRITL